MKILKSLAKWTAVALACIFCPVVVLMRLLDNDE